MIFQNVGVATHKTQRGIVMDHTWTVKFMFYLLLNPFRTKGFFCKTKVLLSINMICLDYSVDDSSETGALGGLPNLNRIPISWALKFKPDNWSDP